MIPKIQTAIDAVEGGVKGGPSSWTGASRMSCCSNFSPSTAPAR